MKEGNKAIFLDHKINRITYKDMRFGECDDSPGSYVPGATTILQAAPKSSHYYDWLKQYGKDADTIMMEAMEKGSAVHGATEKYDRGEEVRVVDENDKPVYSSMEWEMIMRYVDFSDKHKPKIILNESTYGLLSLGYSGTMDRVLEINGENWLLDIKTGNLYEYYFMQLAAYKKLFEEAQMFYWKEIRHKIDRVGILHLNAKTRGEDKTGKAMQGQGWVIETPDMWTKSKDPVKYYYDLFQNVKTMWEFQNPTFKPNNKIFSISIQKAK